MIAGRASRLAARDWHRLRDQRVNGGAVIAARYLVQSERLRTIQGLIMVTGAVLRLVRPAMPARVLTLVNVALQMLQFLLAARAREDAAIAEAARERRDQTDQEPSSPAGGVP